MDPDAEVSNLSSNQKQEEKADTVTRNTDLFLRCCGLPKQVSWPFTMMVSLPHRAWHSSMLCEVSTTDLPCATTACTQLHRNRRAPGSMLVVGSSCNGDTVRHAKREHPACMSPGQPH